MFLSFYLYFIFVNLQEINDVLHASRDPDSFPRQIILVRNVVISVDLSQNLHSSPMPSIGIHVILANRTRYQVQFMDVLGLGLSRHPCLGISDLLSMG